MTFRIRRAKYPSGVKWTYPQTGPGQVEPSPPLDGIQTRACTLLHVSEDGYEAAWTVEVKDLEDLLSLVKPGEGIIIECEDDHYPVIETGLPCLTIYDDYVE